MWIGFLACEMRTQHLKLGGMVSSEDNGIQQYSKIFMLFSFMCCIFLRVEKNLLDSEDLQELQQHSFLYNT